MSVKERIQTKLRARLLPEHLEVDNESRMHNVPAGAETHFKVLAVSAAFEGKSLVERHRQIHEILADELKGGVHALTIRALSPAQWSREAAESFNSPRCLGGEKG